MKRVVIILSALVMALVGVGVTAAPASAESTCSEFGQNYCNQRITNNTVSQSPYIAVRYSVYDDYFYRVYRADTDYFVCGPDGGITQFYVHVGYYVRVQGFFNSSQTQQTLYAYSAGWHPFPAAFKPPACTYKTVDYPKYGRVTMYEGEQ